jgi:hypothetical protein
MAELRLAAGLADFYGRDEGEVVVRAAHALAALGRAFLGNCHVRSEDPLSTAREAASQAALLGKANSGERGVAATVVLDGLLQGERADVVLRIVDERHST